MPRQSKPLSQQWAGYVLDWTTRYHFGRPLPVPTAKWYRVSAPDEQEAIFRLNRMAQHDGHALGGVQGIRKVR